LLKRVQGTSNHSSYPNFRAAVQSNITDHCVFLFFTLRFFFGSLKENGMGEEAEAAIKAAWAPRGVSDLGM
jgi:hypothetical protein